MDDIQLTVGLKADNVTAKAEELQGKIEEIFKASEGKEVSTKFMALQNSMAKSYKTSSELLQQINAIANGEVPTAGYKQLEDKLERIDKLYTRLSDKRKDMELTGQTNTKGYYGLEKQLESLYNNAEAVRGEMEQMQQAGTAFMSPETNTEEFNKLVQYKNLAKYNYLQLNGKHSQWLLEVLVVL